jgi:hypothetical protein
MKQMSLISFTASRIATYSASKLDNVIPHCSFERQQTGTFADKQ